MSIIEDAAGIGIEADLEQDPDGKAKSIARFIVEQEYVAASGLFLPLANGIGLNPDPNNIIQNKASDGDVTAAKTVAKWPKALEGTGLDPNPFLDDAREWLYANGRYARFITRP